MAIIVDVADAAERDLMEIADYLTREAGPSISRRWVLRIEERIATLAESPYVLVRDDRVEVFRILHAAQDRDAIMSQREE